MDSLGALTIVFGLLVGLLMLVRRLGGASVGRGRHVEVVDTAALAPGRNLVLVRVAGRCLLLGWTGDRIERLAEFAADELPAVKEDDVGSTRSLWGRLLRTVSAGT